jgi:hypothetical protein
VTAPLNSEILIPRGGRRKMLGCPIDSRILVRTRQPDRRSAQRKGFGVGFAFQRSSSCAAETAASGTINVLPIEASRLGSSLFDGSKTALGSRS